MSHTRTTYAPFLQFHSCHLSRQASLLSYGVPSFAPYSNIESQYGIRRGSQITISCNLSQRTSKKIHKVEGNGDVGEE